ncbi:hypothetical protein ACHAXH_005904 [Discostella pseudostelligera]
MKSSSSMTMTDIKAGRSRAASRVRQKLRSDGVKWSPSGKMRSAFRPGNRILHRKPWNNRFMFDDDSFSSVNNGEVERCVSGKPVTKPSIPVIARKR